jgi:hypothetical protein
MFAITGMNSVMAHFSMEKWENMIMDMPMMKNMNSNMSDNICESMCKKTTKVIHNCCISPFKNAGLNSNNISRAQWNTKIKIIDFSYLSLLNEQLEQNFSEILTSPPEKTHITGASHDYVNLTGIIKNNS